MIYSPTQEGSEDTCSGYNHVNPLIMGIKVSDIFSFFIIIVADGKVLKMHMQMAI